MNNHDSGVANGNVDFDHVTSKSTNGNFANGHVTSETANGNMTNGHVTSETANGNLTNGHVINGTANGCSATNAGGDHKRYPVDLELEHVLGKMPQKVSNYGNS